MPETNRQLVLQRSLVLMLVLVVIVSISGALFYSMRASRLQRNAKSLEPFVGTWRGQSNSQMDYNIWNLRADGTARWRLNSGKKLGSAGKTIGYAEWSVNSGQLVLHQFSSPSRAFVAHALSNVFGFGIPGQTHARVIEVAPAHFKYEVTYRDTKTGKDVTRTATFVRMHDQIVEDAR